MDNPAANLQIYCSNPHCQAPNASTHSFCQKCQTPLLKRYLWATGKAIKGYSVGQAIADRYLLLDSRILLDTKPSFPPEISQEIPSYLMPYLKLFPYRLHIPQVYGKLSPTGQYSDTWLLEYSELARHQGRELKNGHLFPALTEVWQDTSALRQLNWLCQMVQLWQPLNSQGVVSSLLNSSLLRVNGPVLLLEELSLDSSKKLSLRDLGQLWLPWVETASPIIRNLLQQLCEYLESEQLKHPEHLVSELDKAIANCGRGLPRTYSRFTRTDVGRSREHNEDACYPQNSTEAKETNSGIAIVCDGIGGHEGGEIASQLAIESIIRGINKLSAVDNEFSPDEIVGALEVSTLEANDQISDRNDQEGRRDRQRMGTTVVMTYAHDPEMYITHVGDSRVYWITREGAYQVTVDDDVASREVRLGYSLYRDAIQYPAAGSLIQALGMSSSATLHPTVQRIVLDEDCIFLLCSDGLSDYDRVEQYWETEILPLLLAENGQEKLSNLGNRLIEIANERNGHDNVTVGLVYCQVAPFKDKDGTILSRPELESLPETPRPSTQAIPQGIAPVRSVEIRRRSPWKSLLIILLGLGLVGISYFIYLQVRTRGNNVNPFAISSPSTETPTPTISPTVSEPLSPLTVGSQRQINESISLQPNPGETATPPNDTLTIPAGAIVQIIDQREIPDQGTWLQLQSCLEIPTPESPEEQDSQASPSPSSIIGWIQADNLTPIVTSEIDAENPIGNCPVLPPSNSP
ncbi:MAG: PP2C family protein-serine/threonine phosphatase [Cyanobacteriota bacterium]